MNANDYKQIWKKFIVETWKENRSFDLRTVKEKLHRLKLKHGKMIHKRHRKTEIEDPTCGLCYLKKHFLRSLHDPFLDHLKTLNDPEPKRDPVKVKTPKRFIDPITYTKQDQLSLFLKEDI